MTCCDVGPNDDAVLEAIGTLYRRVFPGRRLDTEEFRECAAKFTGALSVIEEAGDIWGVARCLPIEEKTYNSIFSSRKGVRPYVKPQNILSNDQVNEKVIEGIGTCCFVGMVVWNPERKAEGYRQHSMPLFHHLRNRFYRLRVKQIVSQSETATEYKALKDLGCRPVYRLGGGNMRGVWRFDQKCVGSDKSITSLSDVFEEMWLTKPKLWNQDEDKDLLTRRERQVLTSLMLEGHQRDASRLLGMNYNTFRVHLDSIRQKCNALIDLFPKEPSTSDIMKHCFQNQIEFRVPPEIPL